MSRNNQEMFCRLSAKSEFPREPYVTRDVVCKYLGIGLSTLMTLRKKGLPTHHLGGQKRFKLSEVDLFISSNKGGSI